MEMVQNRKYYWGVGERLVLRENLLYMARLSSKKL
jgi:hypothetical protein